MSHAVLTPWCVLHVLTQLQSWVGHCAFRCWGGFFGQNAAVGSLFCASVVFQVRKQAAASAAEMILHFQGTPPAQNLLDLLLSLSGEAASNASQRLLVKHAAELLT